MKKILSVALSTAMAFSMFASVAFGADAKLTPEQQFNALKEAGIVSGFPDGLSHLERTLTRAELAKIIVNSLSLEPVDATSYNDKNYANHWGRPYIEAATQAGILNGKDAVKKLFDPNGAVTVQELAKVLVTALKLEVPADANNTASAWAKGYVAAAVNAGYLADGINYQAQATRSQAVVAAYAIYEAAQVPTVKSYNVVDSKNVEFTLSNGEVVKVALEKALEPNKATEVTFKTADGKEIKTTVTWVVTAAQKIVSASASNYKEVVVEFDGEVDAASATAIENYKIDGVTFDSASLSSDKKTVTLLIAESSANLSQQNETTLKVSNVKNSDKSKTLSGEVKFKAVDVTLPEATKVEALGTKAFKVTFSEPVTAASVSATSHFRVDDKAIAGYVTFSYPNVAIITTDLAVGTHTLKISDVVDFAGFKVADKTYDFTVAEDNAAPEVTSVKTTDVKKVEIELNEPVKSVSKVYHTSSGKTGVAEVKDNKIIVDFTANPLSLGENTIYLQSVTDYSNNSADREVKVTPQLDTTRPEVVSVKVESASSNNNKFTVEYSKDVLSTDAENPDNYVLKNSKGEVVTGKGFSSKGHPYSVKFVRDGSRIVGNKVEFYSIGALSEGTYTLEISGIRDTSTIANTLYPYSTTVTVSDVSKPEVAASWYEEIQSGGKYTLEVFIQFSKNIAVEGTGTAIDVNKYNYDIVATGVTTANTPIPTNSKVELVNANTVRITFPAKDTTYFPTGTPRLNLRVTNVADTQGNYIANNFYTIQDVKSKATSQITLNKVEVTAKDVVKATFNGILSYVYADDFKLTDGTTDIGLQFVSQEYDGSKTIVTFKPVDDLSTDPTDFDFVVSATTPRSVNAYGISVLSGDTVTLTDKVAPEYVANSFTGADATGTTGRYTATLKFSEDLGPVLNVPGAFSVYVNGVKATVNSIANHATDADKLVITFTTDGSVVINSNDLVEIYLNESVNTAAKAVTDASAGKNAVTSVSVSKRQP